VFIKNFPLWLDGNSGYDWERLFQSKFSLINVKTVRMAFSGFGSNLLSTTCASDPEWK
jgi:hypothetical protein